MARALVYVLLKPPETRVSWQVQLLYSLFISLLYPKDHLSGYRTAIPLFAKSISSLFSVEYSPRVGLCSLEASRDESLLAGTVAALTFHKPTDHLSGYRTAIPLWARSAYLWFGVYPTRELAFERL